MKKMSSKNQQKIYLGKWAAKLLRDNVNLVTNSKTTYSYTNNQHSDTQCTECHHRPKTHPGYKQNRLPVLVRATTLINKNTEPATESIRYQRDISPQSHLKNTSTSLTQLHLKTNHPTKPSPHTPHSPSYT